MAHYLVNYFSQVYLLILEEGLVVLVLLLEVGGYGDVFVYLLQILPEDGGEDMIGIVFLGRVGLLRGMLLDYLTQLSTC